MIIRSPLTSDIKFIASALSDLRVEIPAFNFVVQNQFVLQAHATQLVENTASYVLRIADDAENSTDGKPVGFVLGQVVPFFGSEMRFIADVLLYVVPEYRAKSLAKDLLVDLESEARKRGLHTITFPSTGLLHGDAVDRLCASLGYNDVGRVHRKKL